MLNQTIITNHVNPSGNLKSSGTAKIRAKAGSKLGSFTLNYEDVPLDFNRQAAHTLAAQGLADKLNMNLQDYVCDETPSGNGFVFVPVSWAERERLVTHWRKQGLKV